jgi:hypothetical protein
MTAAETDFPSACHLDRCLMPTGTRELSLSRRFKLLHFHEGPSQFVDFL